MAGSCVFYNSSKYTLDQNLLKLLEACSMARYPPNFGIKNNNVYVNGKNRGKIPEDEKEAFLFLVKNFKKCGALVLENKSISCHIESIVDCDWKKITPKTLKTRFIQDYVIMLAEKYNLTPRETRKLAYTIDLGFIFHSITPNDVEYKNGKILKIKRIKFCKKTREFKLQGFKSNTKTEKNATTSKVYSMYEKFVQEAITLEKIKQDEKVKRNEKRQEYKKRMAEQDT